MPPKATRASRKKQPKGRKRSGNEEIDQQTAELTASQPSAVAAAAAMSDEGDEEKQSSFEAAATSLRKKAKLAATAAAASSFAAGVSASSSTAPSSVPSPCARLDLDSLSVVLSFLNAKDFLHAVRVCRQWRSARTKRTAWPAFNLETMIQLLRDDDFDNPQRRTLEVAVKTGDQNYLVALLSRPGVMELWRHVTEIKLVHKRAAEESKMNKQMDACAAMLQLLPQFASLAALTLDGFHLASDAPAIELFDVLSSRLLMLGLFRCSDNFESQLHRLSSLRVLVLGWIPAAEVLVQLHQLVYLHFEDQYYSAAPLTPQLGFAIRWLSVHHQLCSLSIEGVCVSLAESRRLSGR